MTKDAGDLAIMAVDKIVFMIEVRPGTCSSLRELPMLKSSFGED